ncbi:MAG: HAD hydrolase-like protein [Gammaproteobacteria bacterium]|nr:HAD hydrolase-like protein [Gammaproteobacteria bacterium]
MNLLFDLDGTLTDPREGILASLRHALAQLSIDVADDRALENCIGPPLRDALAGLLPDPAQIEPAVRHYRERFDGIGWRENRVYDGIAESLALLGSRGHRCFVATSKPTVFADRIIAHFGLGEFFLRVYGSELDGRRGDKTELLAWIRQHEGLAAADTVMIGDRKFDMIGARNHGMRAIGVLWGYGSADELRGAGAATLCERPAELPAALATADTQAGRG